MSEEHSLAARVLELLGEKPRTVRAIAEASGSKCDTVKRCMRALEGRGEIFRCRKESEAERARGRRRCFVFAVAPASQVPRDPLDPATFGADGELDDFDWPRPPPAPATVGLDAARRRLPLEAAWHAAVGGRA